MNVETMIAADRMAHAPAKDDATVRAVFADIFGGSKGAR